MKPQTQVFPDPKNSRSRRVLTLSRASFRDDPVEAPTSVGPYSVGWGQPRSQIGASSTRGAARTPRSARCGAVHPRVGHQSWAHIDPQWDTPRDPKSSMVSPQRSTHVGSSSRGSRMPSSDMVSFSCTERVSCGGRGAVRRFSGRVRRLGSSSRCHEILGSSFS